MWHGHGENVLCVRATGRVRRTNSLIHLRRYSPGIPLGQGTRSRKRPRRCGLHGGRNWPRGGFAARHGLIADSVDGGAGRGLREGDFEDVREGREDR